MRTTSPRSSAKRSRSPRRGACSRCSSAARTSGSGVTCPVPPPGNLLLRDCQPEADRQRYGAGAFFPSALANLQHPQTWAAWQLYDRSSGQGARTAVNNWLRYGERMNFIVNVFRSRQQLTALYDQPGFRRSAPLHPAGARHRGRVSGRDRGPVWSALSEPSRERGTPPGRRARCARGCRPTRRRVRSSTTILGRHPECGTPRPRAGRAGHDVSRWSGAISANKDGVRRWISSSKRATTSTHTSMSTWSAARRASSRRTASPSSPRSSTPRSPRHTSAGVASRCSASPASSSRTGLVGSS